jgi:hypothetical protein
MAKTRRKGMSSLRKKTLELFEHVDIRTIVAPAQRCDTVILALFLQREAAKWTKWVHQPKERNIQTQELWMTQAEVAGIGVSWASPGSRWIPVIESW